MLKDIIEAQKAKAVTKFETQIRVQYINQTDLENEIAETAQIVAREVLRKVRETLTKEHYGISYETDTCIECSNHTRIEETLTHLQSLENELSEVLSK
jgi:hypothetical protein